MKKKDKSVFVFMALGVFVILEARAMNIGKFTDPGPGLFPLLLGIILLILSSISLLILSIEDLPKSSEKSTRKNVYYILGVLLAFILVLPVLGYGLTACLLLFFLIKIVSGQKCIPSVFWSILFTGASYLVFVRCLEVRFPKGIIPF